MKVESCKLNYHNEYSGRIPAREKDKSTRNELQVTIKPTNKKQQ
jgi:hypothetical protein